MSTPALTAKLRQKRIWEWLCAPAVRVVALALLFSFMPLWLLHSPYVADPDLGFHLRTGDWVLQHHAVPRIETFSSYTMGKPWVAYSWAFEALLSLLFRWQQLAGIILFGIAMRLAVTLALWRLATRLTSRFWTAVAILVPVLFVAFRTNGPRPVFFSILFVAMVLDAAFAEERDPRPWRRWALAAVFAAWASLHLQFVHGLAILGAFALEATWRSFRGDSSLRPSRHWITLLTCTAATLANPYGWGVWKVIWTFLHEPKLYDLIIEMQAPTFRAAVDYVMLLLVLAAAFALGRSKRIRPVLVLLLVFAAEQAFRSQREQWFAAIISASVIAYVAGERCLAAPDTRLSLRDAVAVALCTVALVAAGARYFNVNNDFLWMEMYGHFPEVSVRYIERAHLHGRIFNDYGWGGYLMWRLPDMPVAIDGRANNVHDQEHVERVFNAWRGKPGWQNDPELLAADVIVGRADYPLTLLLKHDPRFRIAHEDREAVVFVPATSH